MRDNYFISSPFGLTATPTSARCWAGRPEVRQRLERLRRTYQTRVDSSLDVVWANLGAGKSHLLWHLAHMLRDSENRPPSVVAVVEIPDHAKSFLDLYRRIIPELPLDDLAKAVVSCADKRLPSDLKKASQALLHGGPGERSLAEEWIGAGHPHLRDLRNAIGVGERIESDQRACDLLSAIASACASSATRLVLLLDEFQRLAPIPARHRMAIQANLRSVFSANAAFLSVVIAIGSRAEQTALEILPQELRTLMGVRPAVSLPAMDGTDACRFVQERLAFFRPPGYRDDPAAPIGDAAIAAALTFMHETEAARLTPRNILQVLGELYDEAIAAGKRSLTPDDARGILKDLAWQE